MRLPNAENALIERAKLVDYSLNPNHQTGKHKAFLFKKLLGIEVDDVEKLEELILLAIHTFDAEIGVADEYGERFSVDFSVETELKKVKIRTAWIVDLGKNFPRLVSCYIVKN